MKRRKIEIPTIASSEITPESVWLNRRELMQAGWPWRIGRRWTEFKGPSH